LKLSLLRTANMLLGGDGEAVVRGTN